MFWPQILQASRQACLYALHCPYSLCHLQTDKADAQTESASDGSSKAPDPAEQSGELSLQDGETAYRGIALSIGIF